MMGLQRFATFQELRQSGHDPRAMGFAVRVGDINRFANRMRLARSFRGIQLDGYTGNTALGYNALVQMLLTHSALECFLKLNGLESVGQLEELLKPYKPEQVIETFIEKDKGERFFTFLSKHVNPKLKANLETCRNRTSTNVGYISASIRHIFAHGHLTANANRINPRNVSTICNVTSDFLLDFMEREFAKKIDAYCASIGTSTTAIAADQPRTAIAQSPTATP
jgi:hypothetical protein